MRRIWSSYIIGLARQVADGTPPNEHRVTLLRRYRLVEDLLHYSSGECFTVAEWSALNPRYRQKIGDVVRVETVLTPMGREACASKPSPIAYTDGTRRYTGPRIRQRQRAEA